MNKYIAIEGVIGIGKTTLTRLLAPRFQATPLLEVFEENPFLVQFYEDRARYAFQTQIFFLLSRYHQQYQVIPDALQHGTLISDYTFAKDELFAWLNLKDDELAMYGRVHAALSEKIPRPDLIVYLKANHETVMNRIAVRDRSYERDMDPDYIRRLAAAYDAWLSNEQETAVLTIDVTELDYLSSKQDLDFVAQRIGEALLSIETAASPHKKGQADHLQPGTLTNYQRFHKAVAAQNSADADLMVQTLQLNESAGKIAKEVVKIWREQQKNIYNGYQEIEARQTAVARHHHALQSQLAQLLAIILKVANHAGIDLEQAYLDKMRHGLHGENR